MAVNKIFYNFTLKWNWPLQPCSLEELSRQKQQLLPDTGTAAVALVDVAIRRMAIQFIVNQMQCSRPQQETGMEPNSMVPLLFPRLLVAETGCHLAVANASRSLVNQMLVVIQKRQLLYWREPTTVLLGILLATARTISISQLQDSTLRKLVSRILAIKWQWKMLWELLKHAHSGWSIVKIRTKIAIAINFRMRPWKKDARTSKAFSGTTHRLTMRWSSVLLS